MAEVPNLQQFAQANNLHPQSAALNKPPVAREAEPSEDKKKYKSDAGDGENLESNLEEGFEEGRGRRRSKNDVDGRIHKCKYCDKTYLSYPALYTHTK
jgi:hypothetical protein